MQDAPALLLGCVVQQPASSRRVLVVDDEFLIAADLETLLAEAGYDVAVAVSVSEAFEQLDAGPAHAALLDFRLGDGLPDLAQRLQADGVPMVFCTGSMPEEVHALFPDARVVGKPFTGAEVLRTMAAIFAET